MNNEVNTLEKRVVVTGIGVVSPVGVGKAEFWDALIAGKSGIGPITHFDASEYSAQIAGEVKDFDPADFGIDKKEARHMDLSTQFAVAATKLAIDDSAVDLDSEDRDRIGTIIGTGIGGMETLHNLYKGLFEKGPSRINPFVVPKMIANMASGQVSIVFGLKGHCGGVVTACATGTNSIGDAYRMIQRGELDMAVAVAPEPVVARSVGQKEEEQPVVTDEHPVAVARATIGIGVVTALAGVVPLVPPPLVGLDLLPVLRRVVRIERSLRADDGVDVRQVFDDADVGPFGPARRVVGSLEAVVDQQQVLR